MKARFIAALLSLSVVSLPIQANTNPEQPPTQKSSPVTDKIDINKADVSTLTGSVKGIGKKRAEAIVAYREAHHGIKSLAEFSEIKGFGQRFVEKNREKLNEVFVVN
jgi:competence protein ComEA